MEIGSEAQIRAAIAGVIANHDSREVLNFLYHNHGISSVNKDAFDALLDLVPIEQIAVVGLVDKLSLSGLPAVVALLAALRKARSDESWIHYNLAKHLGMLLAAGKLEAKLPATIHALLARHGLKDPDGHPLPDVLLAQELASFAPREAIRSSMLAARQGDHTAFQRAGPALRALGLAASADLPSIARMPRLANELELGTEDIPIVPNTTTLAEAGDLRSVVVEPPRRIVVPKVRGDADYYMFALANREVDMPGIRVHTLLGGTFSIDATRRGRESHYVFDCNGDCVLDLAHGSDPFIAEAVVEIDAPLAILDDGYSGAMNVSHFLLDRVTRIPLYERAWSQPGKFFIVDDFPYYSDIFARLGLSDRLVIPSSRRVSIRAPELLFSSNIAADFRHPAHDCAGWAIEYLRRAFAIEERQSRPERKLMISRRDTVGRQILNWDEVLPIFDRHGFEIVELSGLSTDAQITLFRDASQVVGVHGAGLTNILFAPRDCAVLEILPPLVATHDYWLLASALGQRYWALVAEDNEFPRPDYRTWTHNHVHGLRDIVLSVDRLEAALALLDPKMAASPTLPLVDN
jgi:hypothetical protein